MMIKPIEIGVLGISPKTLGIETGKIRNQRKNQNHPDDSTIAISENTQNSPGDLRRLADSQTPVIDH